MKKLLIGALVGSIILFIWQFLSWAALDLHGSQMEYTAKQDQIMQAINAAGLEDGTYFMPRMPRDASTEEAQKAMEEATGKPWALLQYRNEMSAQSPTNFIRGWAVSFVAVLLLGWLLGQFREVTLSNAVIAAVSVGFIGYLTIPYLNSVWFEGNTIPDLIDAIVPWALAGAWLGWWMPRQ
jgi:hypothetical protein